ncbi:hypothetical protein [Pseudomonas sp. EL_65y_Pfl2_R95]|uniref:hypothetical protein n=1 Tax=Pseudomonas sp. EL_65y_Pfl2_R95 TaxID=3088698 RepID=UPI0030D7CDED
MHEISEALIARVNKRRSVIVGVSVFAILISYHVWHYLVISVDVLVASLTVAFILAIGRGKYFWASGMVEESQWKIEQGKTSLDFYYRNSCARIEGVDIVKLKSKCKDGKLVWFDVYYKKQVTRVKNYNQMEELYQHARKISGGCVTVEEVR